MRKRTLKSDQVLHVYRVVVLILLLGCGVGQASFLDGCKDTYRSIVGRKQILSPERVVILFYPMHVELAIDHVVYETARQYHAREVPLLTQIGYAATEGQPLYYVELKATDEEVNAIKKYMEEHQFHGRNCIRGVCDALNPHLGFTIPPLVRTFPETTLLYLKLVSKLRLSHGRIEEIKFVGKQPSSWNDYWRNVRENYVKYRFGLSAK